MEKKLYERLSNKAKLEYNSEKTLMNTNMININICLIFLGLIALIISTTRTNLEVGIIGILSLALLFCLVMGDLLTIAMLEKEYMEKYIYIKSKVVK